MVDKRTVLWRRIIELRGVFMATLADGGIELSPVRELKVEEAAQLKALAEKARGEFMRDGVGSLDDVVRIERKADAAVRAIGLPPERSGTSRPSVGAIAARYAKPEGAS
jgi:hypothetical protein